MKVTYFTKSNNTSMSIVGDYDQLDNLPIYFLLSNCFNPKAEAPYNVVIDASADKRAMKKALKKFFKEKQFDPYFELHKMFIKNAKERFEEMFKEYFKNNVFFFEGIVYSEKELNNPEGNYTIN